MPPWRRSLLFSCGSLFVGSCATTEGPSLLRTTENGAVVLISDDWRTCGEAADCVEVRIGCDDCCRSDAVRADLHDAYSLEYERLCDADADAACPCEGPAVLPLCRANLCALVEE